MVRDESPPPRRGAAKKVLFGLAAVVVGLALLEFAADCANLWRKARQLSSNAESPWLHDDDYLRYYIGPSREAVVQGRVVTSNSLGFRGKEPRDRPHRVVCMGDSITFGWHASGDDGTYPVFLERELEDLDVDVVNGGMPRCNSMDVFDVYITRVQPLEPDVVVLLVGWNDIGYQLTRPQEQAPKPVSWDAFSTVQLARILLYPLQNKDTDRILAERETTQGEIRWQYVPVYARVLRNFVSAARARGSKVVLCTLAHFLQDELTLEDKKRMLSHLLSWPTMSYDGWRQAIVRMNEAIRGVAKELNVPLVDIEDAIPAELFTDIYHLNDEGNEILAKYVAARVREVIEDE